MKLLIFGDVFGKLGRAGVKRMLPIWRERFAPDVVIANSENAAHGKGIGIKQINELREAGVDIFTGGNHSLEGKDFAEILNDETIPILRPQNILNAAGKGVLLFDASNKETMEGVVSQSAKLLIINLIGQAFMKQQYDNPFTAADKILEEYGGTTPYKILDWHADATSEKTVMGWYLDGKVSAVFGTHTHVPTADAKILPKGTGYISDIGMTGPYNSVIGVEIEPAFKRFRDVARAPINPVEDGPIEVNALYLELEKPKKAAGSELCRTVEIRHLREVISEYTI